MRTNTYTDEELIKAVQDSISFREVLRRLHVKADSGSGYYHLKREICRLGLNIDHFKGMGHFKGKTYTRLKKYDINQLLIENCKVSRTVIKRYILNARIIKYICHICNCEPIWKDQKLVLILDHINGRNNDYRIENLRFVCPNCNSQLNTFTSRNCLNKYNNSHDRLKPYCSL